MKQYMQREQEAKDPVVLEDEPSDVESSDSEGDKMGDKLFGKEDDEINLVEMSKDMDP